VQGTANWKKPKKNKEGIVVGKNSSFYKKNYVDLKLKLSKLIHYGEVIYTHNPWGEYGHEEHVQVFHVIMELAKELNLKVYVNNYVSNKSYLLMTMEQHLLSDIHHIGIPDLNLNLIFKKLYQSNLCWTWNEDYCWPKSESFFEINKYEKYLETKTSRKVIHPLNMLPGNYKTNTFRDIILKILPITIKKKIKNLFKSL